MVVDTEVTAKITQIDIRTSFNKPPWDHPFSTYAKFSGKLTFLTP